jgi:hypothetical protein
MPHESHLGRELGLSLEIFEEMLSGNPVLEKVYKSLDAEEAEPMPNCHGELVYNCIDQFAESELDLANREMLGLGRKDTTFPRLAAYMREEMQQLTTENIFALKLLLFDVVKSGYDFMVLMECTSGRGLKKPHTVVFEQLFLDWVNAAYNFKFEALGPGAALFRDKFAIARLHRLGDEIRPFGLFETYARDARVQHIFRMYIVAGLVLRISEAY